MYLPTNLLIRSIDRDLYSNTQSTSNFTLRLPSDIRNAKKMCLVNCMLPYTFYNIMQNNNDTFLIDSNLITLLPGNYDLNELGNAIQTQVQSLEGTYSSFSVSYNSLTSKGNFSNSTPFVVDFTNRKIANLLGFNKQSYPSTSSLDAIFPINISTLSILIHIDCGSGMVTSSKISIVQLLLFLSM